MSTPLLMGESWPVWVNPMVDDVAETEVELVENDRSQGEGEVTDWTASESILWRSDHCISPSPDMTG
jgi:hypothetical protein